MARLVRKFLGFFGLSHKDEQNDRRRSHQSPNLPNEEDKAPDDGATDRKPAAREPSECVRQGPVICECFPWEDGGVQGLKWYTQKLHVDEDGDYAEEFLSEVVTDVTGYEGSAKVSRFQINTNTVPVKAASRVVVQKGNVFLQGQGKQLAVPNTNKKR
eukprot:TRINITY_DN38851_c0_g1_i1.p1 TRINITY_DN38851_c0_g1~~TRINITY_DN38851_c0_g1_i1.p1  ORF type:complete len:158 (-),score=30.97 TRINITY_DN38851_c0_g1_i1:156-629(-)